MNRRTFIGMLAAGAGASYFSAVARSGAQTASGDKKQARPNIVIIIADDLGWADVGYHNPEIQTPNLDALVKQSVRFDRHYVMPTCTPTRVGLLTGRYPSRYGVLSPAYGKIFNDDTVTLAQALRECGYATSLTGKWHMGSPPDYTPRKYGFDTSYGYFDGQIDPFTHYYKNGKPSWHRNDQFLDEEGHATDLITNEAVRVIDADHDKPFFLYVAYSVPHHPLDEPQEWLAKYAEHAAPRRPGRARAGVPSEAQPSRGTFPSMDPSRKLFAASVTHMDHGIGRIIDALDRKGLRENTLVVFTSDNGGQTGWNSKTEYKGRYADKPQPVLGNNKPLRAWKGDVYEGGIRVPAMANWPGVLKPGALDVPIHIVDWMPTFCGLVGYVPKADPKWDGRDVWSSISKGTDRAELLFYWRTPNASAVRLGDWKLIVPKKGEGPELYDVTTDPYEQHDLAPQHPDRVKDLRKRLTALSADDK
jgi:arylsulfatase A-like enzyme